MQFISCELKGAAERGRNFMKTDFQCSLNETLIQLMCSIMHSEMELKNISAQTYQDFEALVEHTRKSLDKNTAATRNGDEPAATTAARSE